MKNEYAFPSQRNIGDPAVGVAESTGMTLRDYFAAQALQGMYSNSQWDTSNVWSMARWAYQAAEAMMTVRDETNE